MTKTKLTPCMFFKVKKGKVKCTETLPDSPPYTRYRCPKSLTELHSAGKPYVPCNKCLFLGRYQDKETFSIRYQCQ
jgi:hypothetical protein